MPKITFRPSRLLVKTAEYTSIFLVAFSSLFIARKAFSSAPAVGPGQMRIDLQTWDQIASDYVGGTDPDISTDRQLLFGLSTAGVKDGGLYKGTDTGGAPNFDGDLIELGYYKLAAGTPNVDDTNLFAGTWTPLTTKTTIGARHGETGTGWKNLDTANTGEFYYQITYGVTNEGLYASSPTINANEAAVHQPSTDSPAGLGGTGAGHLYDLDFATTGAGTDAEARIGIRFYDIDTPAATPPGWNGSNKAHGTTRYNTIMNSAWKWTSMGANTDAELVMSLHQADGAATPGLVFEFTNSTHNAYSKVGTSDTAVSAVSDYVTTIAYHDGSAAMALDTIGSVVLSGLSGSGNITDGDAGKTLTLHTAAGNMLVVATGDDDGTSFAGGISGDITLIKTGGTAGDLNNDGEQTLTGVIDTTGYADIKGGTLILAPGANAQSFEYITGAGNLGLVNATGQTQTVVLGFASTTTTKTLSGAVDLSGTGTATTIKVVSDTAKTTANYNKEQVFSGIVSGTETLTKSGLGRLMLSGANTFDGGSTDVIIDDGTLVAGHADALGGASTTVRIDKGKLEIGDGNNGAVTLHSGTTINGSAVGKSMVGGDGTIAALIVGSATTEVDVISPGRGISSSLTSATSQQQVTLGTGGAAKAMGDLTVTALSLFDGGVYDWEISDFTGVAGTGFDVLKFNTLAFDAGGSASFGINAFAVANATGAAGAIANLGAHTGTNGILFLDGPNHAAINWGGGTALANSGWQQADYFNVDDRGYNYHNGNLNGGWNVWYNGSGDFYMRYSAVPEPSTYVMVMGLLLVPGFRFFRRFRKKGIKQEDQ
jgi:autotransporter-associated beta strand protein